MNDFERETLKLLREIRDALTSGAPSSNGHKPTLTPEEKRKREEDEAWLAHRGFKVVSEGKGRKKLVRT